MLCRLLLFEARAHLGVTRSWIAAMVARFAYIQAGGQTKIAVSLFFSPQAVIKITSKLPHIQIRTNYYSYIYRTHANINCTIYGQQTHTHRFALPLHISPRVRGQHFYLLTETPDASSLFYDLISRGFRLRDHVTICFGQTNQERKKSS